MEERSFIAFDLGAESGRTVLGTLSGDQLSIRQVTRFPNEMKMIDHHLRWDVASLMSNLKEGLRACFALNGLLESVGVDTWGVDYAVIGSDGLLAELPYAYRDSRTNGMMEKFFELVPQRRVYELTGIQFMQLNTLFQLYAHIQEIPRRFENGEQILFMPDLFNFLLSGAMKTEFTISTTSQLYNPRPKQWEKELFAALGVPLSAMQEIVQPGSVLGPLRENISREVSGKSLSVTAVASHDTASAIAAIPAEGEDWAYISSGTWSLMGIVSRHPIISDEAMQSNFTNEGGIGGTIRFLKNIMGMWLLQQCRKEWAAEIQYTYEDLMHRAAAARQFRSFIDPDSSEFFNPPSMVSAIQSYCRQTGQPEPEDHAEFVRCIMESLALKYRYTLDQLQTLAGKRLTKIHIIGGGALNELLCQFTANATSVPVFAGPVEATAIGNIMMQAFASGCVRTAAEIRNIVKTSFKPIQFTPLSDERWQEAYGKFKIIVSRDLKK